MSTVDKQSKFSYTQNRELSWLRFNKRVLEEAGDRNNPALERLKFVAIFSSNLDEFFMVRVGSLFDISKVSPQEKDNKTGMDARQQLDQIYNCVPGLIELKKQIYQDVTAELARYGIEDLHVDQLTSEERKFTANYFKNNVLPILSPIIIGSHHPVPHLAGKKLYVAATLKDKKGKSAVGILPVPDSLPPYLKMPGEELRYVRMENLLLFWCETLFGEYHVTESCVLSVTRNADISFDDEKFEDSEEDFRRQFTKMLKKRDRMSVVRLEISMKISEEFCKILRRMTKIERYQVYLDTCPLNMKYVYALEKELSPEKRRHLIFRSFKPRWPEDLHQSESMIEQIRKKDELLFYPFDSVDPFLKLLSEAAEDPEVISIKITIYRLAATSKIGQILCRAAERGKDVLVLMELRARFDEANNLAWSSMLEEAGCQVIYGMDGFKCHSKICLITRKHKNKMEYITQVGTGNYNEKTNAMYTDLSLMTASELVGQDATLFFRNMLTNNLDGKYQQLLVSPYGIKNELCRQIDAEIKRGSDGYICIKVNSVTEREMIDKLAEASEAGVKIDLIVRGICCILPGISQHTENIRITSIVGRFLEHARIYCFGKGQEQRLYISSADMMTRNLNRRVEIACPVYDRTTKEMLRWILNCQLQDNEKASFMMSDGTYSRKRENSVVPFDCQKNFMEISGHEGIEFRQDKKIGMHLMKHPESGLWQVLENFFRKIRMKFGI